MKQLTIFLNYLLLIFSPILLLAQQTEIEPNDTRENANLLSLGGSSVISAEFGSTGDLDYFVMELKKDCIYYLTSIENEGVAPNLDLFVENNPTSILKSDVSGRNGNNNFRLSGYVPFLSGRFYAKIFEKNGARGRYKVRLAGGRSREQLIIHEPDNTMAFSSVLNYLAEADTVYGALYPENDIDYYKIYGTAGKQFNIGTLPILDLQERDTDTFITLINSAGATIAENDDIGTVNTTSGPVNCTFSKITGIFPQSGDYYLAVRSYYNTHFGQTTSESNPPMGEYGVYYLTQAPEPGNIVARYPHIEVPTIQSAGIQWRTSTLQPTYLKWGPTDACSNLISDLKPGLDHFVNITGLAPYKKYFYRIFTSAGDSLATEHFYTAKPATLESVNFFVISDSSPYAGGGSSPEQRQVAEQIQKLEYDFGLHAGDVNQHIGEEYDLVFFQPYKDILKNATIFPCIGNHDMIYDQGQTYLASFNLPHNNPDSTERYYSFNYGHAHFICLDTNIPYYPDSPQYKWLQQDLESQLRRQTMWTFVYFHHPPWSEGWPGYPGEVSVREYLVPLFEQYQVDMVFNGHTHDYERGFLNGVYYIITGGGGCTLEDGIQAYDWDHVDVWINQHQFCYIQLHDKSLELRSINKDGLTIDLLYFDKHVTNVGENFSQTRQVSPGEYRLYQNFPNPFNSTTQIFFDIKDEAHLQMQIFDINGKIVRRLVTGNANPGYHQVQWDGTNDAGILVSSGIYFVNLRTPKFTQTLMTIFLK